MTKPDNQTTIEAVDRAFRVVEVLRDLDGAGVTKIANNLGWAKSTVHTHLRTLEENEYVVRERDQYVLASRFLDFGEYIKNRKRVYTLVQPKLEELADRTDERVQFIVNEHGYGVYVRIATGEHAVSTGAKLGRHRSILHASAAGKAILAYLPQEQVEEIIEYRGLPRHSENTITDSDELFAELSTIHDRGYAFNHEEHINGLKAVAVPVKNSNEEVLGSISVAGAARRMQGEWFQEELPELVLGAANEVELDLAYS